MTPTRKYELAHDVDGRPFLVPIEAKSWSVRKNDGPGRPGVAHDLLGRPLVVPIEATYLDLYRAAGPGRYKLDAIDELGQLVPGVPSACTGMMHPRALDESPDSLIDRPMGSSPVATFGNNELLAEVIRANMRMAELVVNRIPSVLTAAAELITAADGANLPARRPLPPPPEPAANPDDDQSDEPPPVPGMPAWLNMVVQAVVSKLMDKIPGLSELSPEALSDWSKAVPQPAPEASVPPPIAPPLPPSPPSTIMPPSGRMRGPATARYPDDAIDAHQTVPSAERPATSVPADLQAATAVGVPTTLSESTTTSLRVPDRAAVADSRTISEHVLQVWSKLTVSEQERVQALIAALTPEERSQWVFELGTLSVSDAVARVRDVIRPRTGPPTKIPSS